jgi:hypothetical protein
VALIRHGRGRPFISTPAGGVVNMVAGALRRAGRLPLVRQWRPGRPRSAGVVSALCDMAENPGQIAPMGECGAAFAGANHSLPSMLSSLDALYSALLEKDSRVEVH